MHWTNRNISLYISFLTIYVCTSYIDALSCPSLNQKANIHSSLTYTQNKFLSSLSYGKIRTDKYRKLYLKAMKEDDCDGDELCEMEVEIEELRKEATMRINALSDQIKTTDVMPENDKLIDTKTSNGSSEPKIFNTEKTAVSNAISTETYKTKNSNEIKKVADLMDNTQWKIMLNIGREKGTWMPKTWGISGERLRATFEINFTPDQLYDREEFLGGVGGAKNCEIIDNTITLSPSLTEGTKKIHVKSGGWRVSRGDGPLGTDLLRFYIELDEEMSHSGSDVYCPKGRIYMQCGLFELQNNNFGRRKEQLRQELDDMSMKYDKLRKELEEKNTFSFDKLKLTRNIFQASLDMRMINAKLNDARVIEPDKGLLKTSQDGAVGLTREGGVVCKVMKGAVREYHILGKFALASVEPKKEPATKSLHNEIS